MFNIKPLTVAPVVPSQPTASHLQASPNADELQAAGNNYHARGQTNNAAICQDMSAKLRRFGKYASEKQQAFARSLVERAFPQQVPAAIPAANVAPAPATRLPDLFAVMQKHASFYVGKLTLNRQNQESRVWIRHADAEKCVGKIEGGVLTLWNRPGVDRAAIEALLQELEANPLLAAKKYGRLSGRCCSCGRDLTDEDSIAAGIGPVCATKFN